MKIGVVGAGLMGAEIALVFAIAGMDVLLNDRDQGRLDIAMRRLGSLLDRGVARGLYRADEAEAGLRNISTSTTIERFADRDLVIEAVFEAVEVKRAVLEQLARTCRDDCVIASNTSTIPISTLAAFIPVERRGKVIGTHFFSPVSRMALVEVVPGFDTGGDTVSFVIDCLDKIGKRPIRVKDVPGFAVNRLLHAMLIEAVKLVEEGVVAPDDLDLACRLGLGHPLGPFQLMDLVSSGLCLQVQEILQEAYGERFRPPALLKQRVRAGYEGGRGKPGWLPGPDPAPVSGEVK
ncbi:3-hydroxyacyl-CoA dehydrogenase family protein [Sphingomonas crusticola]|uniref:3-hydroxyacyl-CoA dehydrogenase family protein n=1 Tax=Sphingomonas crusticola TaxID=1697973 RepID=UPI000E23607B|nr:3-hydroxyacyl-CoA dehydrogenase family protein [Sphingomonas crusticola]